MNTHFITQLLTVLPKYFNKPYTDNIHENTSLVKTINGYK